MCPSSSRTKKKTTNAYIKPTPQKNMTGFLITVIGQYYSLFKDSDGHKQKKIRNYSIQVRLPKMDAALSVIKNYLLDKALRAKYPDYTKYRTYIIKNAVAMNGTTVNDIRYMSLSQLKEHVERIGLDINTSIFSDVQELREAVRRINEDHDSYKAWELKLSDERSVTSLLHDLNPEFMNEDNEDESNALFEPVKEEEAVDKEDENESEPKSKDSEINI
jgi:hypothetical protein